MSKLREMDQQLGRLVSQKDTTQHVMDLQLETQI